MTQGDTIAAFSSATSPAARIILRLSGPKAFAIAASLSPHQTSSTPSGAIHTKLTFRGLTIFAWLYTFVSPNSYTGEDVVEFHIPGNPLLAKMLLEELFRAGARGAEAGEFTARAYFNGRVDLTEAEGIAATIYAVNEQELSAARRLMSGELSRRLAPVVERVANTLALLEAGIDFSDEDISFLSADDLLVNLAAADGLLQKLLDDSIRFERITHEPTVVLAGRPNAGKSTLLNALAGHQRAVVSATAGTTRDILSAEVALPRGIVKVMDVAGLDAADPFDRAGDAAQASIDRKMQDHARRAIEEADWIVSVRAVSDDRAAAALPRNPDLVVVTKIDLLGREGSRDSSFVGSAPRTIFSDAHETVRSDKAPARAPAAPKVLKLSADPTRSARGDSAAGDRIDCASRNQINVSALTGEGIDALRTALDRLCFGDGSNASALALNARHTQSIHDGKAALSRAAAQASAGPEIIALELREALDALSGITGRITADDLLGRIFSVFCIGK